MLCFVCGALQVSIPLNWLNKWNQVNHIYISDSFFTDKIELAYNIFKDPKNLVIVSKWVGVFWACFIFHQADLYVSHVLSNKLVWFIRSKCIQNWIEHYDKLFTYH